jgi:RNA recognition motif-containing protein
VKKRRLFVGGLPWAMDDADLQSLFEEGDEGSGTEGCGGETVEAATVVRDRETRKSRGFAFITMSSLEKAAEAIKKFNNLSFKGRTLKVDEAADQSANRRSENPNPNRTGNYLTGSSEYPFKQKKEYKEY